LRSSHRRNGIAPKHSALTTCVYATLLLTPLVVDIAAYEAFRFPKEMVARAGCIAMLALILYAVATEGWRWLSGFETKKTHILLVAIIAWSALTTATAANRILALESFGLIFLCVVLYASSFIVAKERRSFALIAAMLVPATINAIILILQATQIWSPFSAWIPSGDRVSLVALLGNPNDVGGYLAPATILGVATALATRNLWAAMSSVICCAAVVATQGFTGIAAMALGLLAVSILKYRWRAVYATAVMTVVIVIGLFAYRPLHERMDRAIDLVRRGDVNAATSNRLTAFTAAIEMFRDHPLLGVGPGGYAFAYFDYKIRAEVRHPYLAQSMSRATNFAEAHNDHLEMLAEGGLPAYILFLAALFLTMRPSMSEASEQSTSEFARLAALPLVVTLATSAMAHFPLQLAVSLTLYVCAAAAVRAWGEVDGI